MNNRDWEYHREEFMNMKTWSCILLVLVTFGIYYQTSNHDFINYDDPSYIINNPHVNTGLNDNNVAWAFTSVHSANWHPLTWLSHMLDVQLFGLDPKWHHLTNVLFHIANTLLLYFLLFRTTRSHWKSSFIAALFALHPLHVESVAWVAERKDVLSAFFFFVALILYDWYVRRPYIYRYILVFCAFALGLMSKPMLVTFPFLLLLMDYWPLHRISFNQKSTELSYGKKLEANKQTIIRLVVEKLPFFVLSIASCIVTFYAQLKGGAVAKIIGVPLGFRLMNALVAYVSYMFKMVWPFHLSVIYPLPESLTALQGLGAFLFLAILSVTFIRLARRHPPLIVGWLWYIGTLVPVIGLVQVGNQSMADRYTYIPFIGLFIIAAWGIPAILPEIKYRNAVLATAASVLLFASATLAWIQLTYWENSITLFRHAIDAVADNYVAHNLLGNTLTKQGRFDEAISNFSVVLHKHPDNEEALTGMGIALAKQGDLEGSVQYFRMALDSKPDSAEDHSNLGFTLAQLGKDREGIHHLSEALRLEPDSPKNAEIHFHIGTSFASLREIDEAIYHFKSAIRIKPDFVEAHYDLGVAMAKQGNLDLAIDSFSEALRLKPDFTDAALYLEKAINKKKSKNNVTSE